MSTFCSGTYQRKRRSSASLAFVRGIHRWPVDPIQKGPVSRKIFWIDDIITDAWSRFRHISNEIFKCIAKRKLPYFDSSVTDTFVYGPKLKIYQHWLRKSQDAKEAQAVTWAHDGRYSLFICVTRFQSIAERNCFLWVIVAVTFEGFMAHAHS